MTCDTMENVLQQEILKKRGQPQTGYILKLRQIKSKKDRK